MIGEVDVPPETLEARVPVGRRGGLLPTDAPDIRPVVAWLLAVGLYLWYTSLQPGTFNMAEIGTLAATALPLIALGLGEGIVILTGGIDLSVGGVFGLGSAIAGAHFTNAGQTALWAAIIIAIGIATGCINGFLVGRLALPPFIVTLATWWILDGVALLVLPVAGGTVPIGFSNWILDSALGVPNAVWATAVLVVVWLWFKRTRSARRIFALGSDPEGARFSGVNSDRTIVVTYVISGVCAAVASLFYSMYSASGDPASGDGYILTAVAAVVIGGTSLRGGQGGFLGTVAGAMVLTLVPDVVFALHLSPYWTEIVNGVVLVAAVVVLRWLMGGWSRFWVAHVVSRFVHYEAPRLAQ